MAVGGGTTAPHVAEKDLAAPGTWPRGEVERHCPDEKFTFLQLELHVLPSQKETTPPPLLQRMMYEVVP